MINENLLNYKLLLVPLGLRLDKKRTSSNYRDYKYVTLINISKILRIMYLKTIYIQ
jgi:hypothetical protein